MIQDPVLLNDWHPVLRSDTLISGYPRAVRLLPAHGQGGQPMKQYRYFDLIMAVALNNVEDFVRCTVAHQACD